MKLSSRNLLLTLCTLTLPLGVSAQVPSNDAVRVEVRVLTESDHKDIKNATADTITQGKTLQIAISGKAKEPETRSGKWTIYGRDLKDNGLVVLQSGDFKVELVRGAQSVSSAKITTTYTPKHTIATQSRGTARGGRVAPPKKVEATGTKYAGYSVVISDGDKVAGAAFDPSGIQKEASK